MSEEQRQANRRAISEFSAMIEAVERGDYREATDRSKALHAAGWSVRARWPMDGSAGARKPRLPRPGPILAGLLPMALMT